MDKQKKSKLCENPNYKMLFKLMSSTEIPIELLLYLIEKAQL